MAVRPLAKFLTLREAGGGHNSFILNPKHTVFNGILADGSGSLRIALDFHLLFTYNI